MREEECEYRKCAGRGVPVEKECAERRSASREKECK